MPKPPRHLPEVNFEYRPFGWRLPLKKIILFRNLVGVMLRDAGFMYLCGEES